MRLRPLRDQAALDKLKAELGREAVSACPPLLLHMLAGCDVFSLVDSPERLRRQAEWRGLLGVLARTSPPSEKVQERFHTQWHVCHHFVRELVDDDPLMLGAARGWLPRYEGPELELFRGENIDRYQAGRIGYGWTDQASVADMFASGLNALGAGGVVLTAKVPASAIIAGPAWHSSDWLQENEYTVDVQSLPALGIVAWHRR